MSLCVCVFNCIQFVVTPQTVVHQAPLSMEFSRQEYWSGLPSSPPGDLPNPGIKPESLVSPALPGRFLPREPPGKPSYGTIKYLVPCISAFRWLRW